MYSLIHNPETGERTIIACVDHEDLYIKRLEAERRGLRVQSIVCADPSLLPPEWQDVPIEQSTEVPLPHKRQMTQQKWYRQARTGEFRW